MILNAGQQPLPGLPAPMAEIEPHRTRWGGDGVWRPDPAKLADAIRPLSPEPRAVFLSIEHVRTFAATKAEAARLGRDVLRAVKREQPQWIVFLYDPSLRIDPGIPGEKKRADAEVTRRLRSSVEREALSLADVLSPDLYYMGYPLNGDPETPNYEMCERYLPGYVDDAHARYARLKRPVAPAIRHRFHQGNGLKDALPMTGEFWRLYAEAVNEKFGHAVWWNGPSVPAGLDANENPKYRLETPEELANFVRHVTTGD